MTKESDFLFSSATCGFKKTKKPDLAVVYSPVPCNYAGVFTTNQIHAACVDENKRLLKLNKSILLSLLLCKGKVKVIEIK